MKNRLISLLVVLVAGGAGWMLSTPPSYNEIGDIRVTGEVPGQIRAADIGDVIKSEMVTLAADVIPGHDEILPIPGTTKVLVSARDEWIYSVDYESGDVEKIAFAPVSPTGAHIVPGSTTQAYFCMARLDLNSYESGPGLYLLDIEKGQFSAVVTRVPITGSQRRDGLEIPNYDDPHGAKIHPEGLNNTAISELSDDNSRPMQFCNDLDVSEDGRYVYTTEPFSYPRASSGIGAVREAITLARNGRIWRYDTVREEIGLIVENVIFADGILTENDDLGEVESLLITETANFRISRAHMGGERAGQYDVLWDNLHGLPDGLDRDSEGRIWVGIIKNRSKLMDTVHANPWLKHVLLRIPPKLLQQSDGGTGFVVLSEDASKVLAKVDHDGTRVRDLSVIVPSEEKVWLSSFYSGNRGIHYISVNAVLESPTNPET